MPIVCSDPTSFFTYEIMGGMSEFERLTYMRDKYCEAATCYGEAAEEADNDEIRLELESLRDNYQASCNNMNQAMVSYEDGIPVDPSFFHITRMGEYTDELSKNTRRSTPLGTVITEMDGWVDAIPTAETRPEETFEEDTEEDLEAPNFDGIEFTPQEEGIEEVYSKDHITCLDPIKCIYTKPIVKNISISSDKSTDIVVEEEEDDLDIDLDIGALTSGCANGDGIFDKMMTAIDSSIDLQYKNNRLDAKTFTAMYGDTLQGTMQQAVVMLIEQEKLELAEAELELKLDSYGTDKAIKLSKAKYEVELLKAQVEKTKYEAKLVEAQTKLQYLNIDERVAKLSIELSILGQEAKTAEKQVELVSRQIEQTDAQTKKIYRDRVEARLDGKVNRNLTEAKTENTRVQTKTEKFRTHLTKEQTYSVKVNTNETKVNNASNRRVNNAEVQTKNQQAMLFKQQSKGYTQQHRENILKIMRDMWGQQLENVGAENMVIEAVKGPEMSSLLSRASIDSGL